MSTLISEGRPSKRVKLLLDDDDSSDSSSPTSGGVLLKETARGGGNSGFRVNEEYARRFEHNQRRAEIHRLEEKYGETPARDARPGVRDAENENLDGTDSSTDSEEEDDEGILALGPLDEQFNATLEAVRAKDPRVYDGKTTFYTSIEEEEEVDVSQPTKIKEKPMYLSDYHRKNLLRGDLGDEVRDDAQSTYAQLQDDLKNTVVKEMHAAAESDADDDFLVPKQKLTSGKAKVSGKAPEIQVDVEIADKDPEFFLSNYLAAKAWVPSASSKFQPFESDDEGEDQRAEDFEAAYNLRFEDPATANEKLKTHARDTAAKYSVRREEVNPRKKAREAEREKNEMEKRERDQEKARLRKLRIEEAEEKVRKIKEAAGLGGKKLQEQDWIEFLNEGWDDARWEAEMKRRFGDDYYADHELEDSDADTGNGKKKPKKPKWDDDIDIKDLVPEFEAEEQAPQFSLSEDSDDEMDIEDNDSTDRNINGHKKGKKLSQEQISNQKREARKDRRKVEQLVDENLAIEFALPSSSKQNPKRSTFRYRETSPISHGLTSRDILLASDSQLNQFAGLKKLAAFRDTEKKRKDKKFLGKKARLRQWRKDTFGSEEGPQKDLKDILAGQAGIAGSTDAIDVAESTSKRSKKRKRKTKNVAAEN
ncbi:MAG: KRRI-Interacting protein 1 [Icmadophila ericetorum]|nr:KRRI-Interacting protein 1 [Icmadophila ericetorum]